MSLKQNTPGSPQRLNLRILIPLFLILICIVAVYVNSLVGEWHYDDIHHIRDNPNIRNLSNIPKYFTDATTFTGVQGVTGYRPLLMVTHSLNYWASQRLTGNGLDVRIFHLFNLALHVFATFMVFFVILKLLVNHPINGQITVPTAALTAILFGIHTINSQAVNYIAARSSILAAGLTFTSFFVYLQATHFPRSNKVFLFLSGLFYFGAIMSKEIALALPLILLSYEIFANRADGKSIWQMSRLKGIIANIIPFLALTGLYFFLRIRIAGDLMMEVLAAPGGRQADIDKEIASNMVNAGTFPVSCMADLRQRLDLPDQPHYRPAFPDTQRHPGCPPPPYRWQS